MTTMKRVVKAIAKEAITAKKMRHQLTRVFITEQWLDMGPVSNNPRQMTIKPAQ